VTAYRRVERWVDEHPAVVYRWCVRALGSGCVVVALLWGFWAAVASFAIGLAGAMAGLCSDAQQETDR
jgi:hypothetical protein